MGRHDDLNDELKDEYSFEREQASERMDAYVGGSNREKIKDMSDIPVKMDIDGFAVILGDKQRRHLIKILEGVHDILPNQECKQCKIIICKLRG